MSLTLENGIASVTTNKCENPPSTLQSHTFKITIPESQLSIAYWILKLADSFFIWIGPDNSPSFTDLSLAFLSKFQATPVVTKILGPTCDQSPSTFPQRLSRKLKKPVYLSYNISNGSQSVHDAIEKTLMEEIQNNTTVFST